MYRQCLPKNHDDDVKNDGYKNEKIVPIKSFDAFDSGSSSEADENDSENSSAPHDALDHLSLKGLQKSEMGKLTDNVLEFILSGLPSTLPENSDSIM